MLILVFNLSNSQDNILNNDTIFVYSTFNRANELKSKNSDSAIYYYIKAFRISLPLYVKNKISKVVLFKSNDEIYNFFQINNLSEKYRKVVSNIFPYLKNDCELYYYFLRFKLFDDNFTKLFDDKLVNHIIYLKNKNCFCEIGKLFLQLGNYYYNITDLKNSLKYYHLSYQIFKKVNDIYGISKVLNNISIINTELKNYREAEKYIKESIEIKKSLKDTNGLSSNYSNLSSIYNEKAIDYFNKNIDSANHYKKLTLYFINLSKEIDSIRKDEYGLITNLINEATIYTDFKEYDKSLKIYNKLDKLFLNNRHYFDLKIYSNINKAELYRALYEETALSENQKNNYLQESKKLLEEALSISTKNNFPYNNKEIYNNLYLIELELKNYKEALNYYLLCDNIKDSLFNIEKVNYINNLEKTFESNRQKEKIVNLEKEKKWLKNQRFIIYIFIIIFAVLSSIVIYQINKRLIISKKQNNIIKAQKEKIENIYNELLKKNEIINQNIEYTRHIQNSFLINESILKKIYTNAFIIYMPKNELSGDFYYFKEKNGLQYLALGDCAGHGIPGAVMSLVTTTILNQIISATHLIHPNEILEKLHFELLALQCQRSYDLTESVEISLCCFDKINKNVYISTTNQDLYILKDEDFSVINGDIYSIGQVIEKDSPTLKVKLYQIKYNNRLKMILVTDGFYDEYNYSQKKRFGKARFEQLVKNIISYPLSDIKQSILKEYRLWKDTDKQVDDITMIGIEI
ncbi:MAG: tetratricopeptide repeat protein [Bacteroidales bacterium]|nr:tetratricopeptide repeat protein [Bacteroidales bacterium]